MKIVFATNNRNKLEEVSAILGPSFTLLTSADCGLTDDIPEDQDTLEGNALQKARYVKEHTGYDCFADDTGMEVEALGGEPGVRSARYVKEHTGYDCFADDTGMEVEALGGEPGVRSARYATDGHDPVANMALLLKKLAGEANRKARFRTVIALILDGKEYTFQGEVRGRITESPSGDKGFGYDPVFVPDGYSQTFAELPAEVKNRISHRGEAVRRLAEFLATTGSRRS